MRTNIVLDDALVEEALALTDAKSKRQVVHMALEELVHRRKKKDLTELSGKIRFRSDFDHKSLRSTRGGIG